MDDVHYPCAGAMLKIMGGGGDTRTCDGKKMWTPEKGSHLRMVQAHTQRWVGLRRLHGTASLRGQGKEIGATQLSHRRCHPRFADARACNKLNFAAGEGPASARVWGDWWQGRGSIVAEELASVQQRSLERWACGLSVRKGSCLRAKAARNQPKTQT